MRNSPHSGWGEKIARFRLRHVQVTVYSQRTQQNITHRSLIARGLARRMDGLEFDLSAQRASALCHCKL